MAFKKFITSIFAIMIMANSLPYIPAIAASIIPDMPQGNSNLYNENASFLNSNISGLTNPVGFSHNAGVLSNNNATAENSCTLFTGITGLSQMTDPQNNNNINTDTLTYISKTKMTISSGADASWKGGAVVLRYDSNTKYRLTLRYSPAYNSTQGVLRIVGYTSTTSYPFTQVLNTNSSQVDLAIVQTKTTITVHINNSFLFTYTLPVNSPYLSMPYSFGLTSVNSLCNLSQTSLYFAERVDNPAMPPMPQGNASLYNPYTGFENANVYENSVSFIHNSGILYNTSKTAENSCILNNSITGLTQVVNPSDNSSININALTFVARTKLTIQDMDSTSWYGAGIILRYDPSSKKRMMLRYSQDGNLRITGFHGVTVDYLASVGIKIENTMYLTVTQTSNTIYVSVNHVLVLNYSLPSDSTYLETPYAFGLYTVYSVSNLSETSLYFKERVNQISSKPPFNYDLYSENAGFAVQSFYGNDVNYSNSNGVLRNTSSNGENLSVIKTPITGQTQMVDSISYEKKDIDSLTMVTKTKLTIENVAAVGWYGAGVVIRYDALTDNRLSIRYSIDGKLRLVGVSGVQINYFDTVDCQPAQTSMYITVKQTKNTIHVYLNDVLYLRYTLANDSVFLSTPYAFGLYTIYSVSNLSESSVYFAESVHSVSISSGISFRVTNNLMSGFTEHSKIADLKAGISGADIFSVEVYDRDNLMTTDIQQVETGMKIRIMDSNNHPYLYNAIVYGDTNGDGNISILDLANLKNHILKSVFLNGIYLTAGDLSAKGDITISDLVAVKKHVLGIAHIDQNIQSSAKTLKVLAIGNSFSQDAVEYLRNIAVAGGVDIMVGNMYIGGCSLETHWMNANSNLKNYTYFKFYESKSTFNNASILEVLESDDWDYIVMQQVSQDSGLPGTYEPYLTNLSNYIKTHEPQAVQLLHQTWAYEIDSTHTGFANYNNNQQTMFTAIKDAYSQASQRLGMGIIPCGDAMQKARSQPVFDYANGGKTLCRDGFHANYIQGRYLLASVWYETLTGKSILNNTFTLPGMTLDEQNILKQAVHDAVLEY